MALSSIFVKDLAYAMDLFKRFSEIDGQNSAMSNLINLRLCLSDRFLNQLITVAVLRHWLTSALRDTSAIMSFRYFLLIRPTSQKAKPVYETALNESGYKTTMT